MSSRSVKIIGGPDREEAHVDGVNNALQVSIVSGGGGGGDVNIDEVGGTPIGSTVPVSDGGGSLSVDDGGGALTVDGTVGVSGDVEVTQDTHDDLNVNANLQVGDADVATANPVPVVDLRPRKAHDGLLWTWSTVAAVTGDGTIGVRIGVVTKDMHARIRLASTGAFQLDLYENAQFTAIGPWQTARSHKRDVDEKTQGSLQYFFDPAATLGAGGTLIHQQVGVDELVLPEWVLTPTQCGEHMYYLQLTDLSGAAQTASLSIEYYQEESA